MFIILQFLKIIYALVVKPWFVLTIVVLYWTKVLSSCLFEFFSPCFLPSSVRNIMRFLLVFPFLRADWHQVTLFDGLSFSSFVFLFLLLLVDCVVLLIERRGPFLIRKDLSGILFNKYRIFVPSTLNILKIRRNTLSLLLILTLLCFLFLGIFILLFLVNELLLVGPFLLPFVLYLVYVLLQLFHIYLVFFVEPILHLCLLKIPPMKLYLFLELSHIVHQHILLFLFN